MNILIDISTNNVSYLFFFQAKKPLIQIKGKNLRLHLQIESQPNHPKSLKSLIQMLCKYVEITFHSILCISVRKICLSCAFFNMLQSTRSWLSGVFLICLPAMYLLATQGLLGKLVAGSIFAKTCIVIKTL